jgi:hypothetical protein
MSIGIIPVQEWKIKLCINPPVDEEKTWLRKPMFHGKIICLVPHAIRSLITTWCQNEKSNTPKY